MRQELFAEPEIGEHDVSLWVEQNILQFDIAVNDAQLKQINRVELSVEYNYAKRAADRQTSLALNEVKG